MKPLSLMAITAFVLSGAAAAQYSSSQSSSSQPQPTSQSQGQQAAPSESRSTSGTTGATDMSTSGSATTSGTMPAAPSAATSGTTSTTTSSTTTTSTQAAAPKLIEQKVDLTSPPGPPADPQAARQEAVNAVAWAKKEGCRDDPSPRECVRRVADDARQNLAQVNTSGGTVSASGTSAAPGARADRN